MITRIEITEHLFGKSEILLLECSELDYDFVLDSDRWISDEEIIEHIHAYYILGITGGMIRKGKYVPWDSIPASTSHALDACDMCKNIIRRTYTRISKPDPKNPSIVAKELIE